MPIRVDMRLAGAAAIGAGLALAADEVMRLIGDDRATAWIGLVASRLGAVLLIASGISFFLTSAVNIGVALDVLLLSAALAVLGWQVLRRVDTPASELAANPR